MYPHPVISSTATGTIGGTLLSAAANIQSSDLEKTALLAVIGATTSFICSLLLKQGLLWMRNRKK
ncbi:MAG: hypothetical protein JWO58_2118 [Chitinophagaceae bacterium]|nr:hypothetical protein [Chitinophagaceae bacterium]